MNITPAKRALRRLQLWRARLVRPRQELYRLDPRADSHQSRSQMRAQRTERRRRRAVPRVHGRGIGVGALVRRRRGEGAEAQDGNGAIFGQQEEEGGRASSVSCRHPGCRKSHRPQ